MLYICMSLDHVLALFNSSFSLAYTYLALAWSCYSHTYDLSSLHVYMCPKVCLPMHIHMISIVLPLYIWSQVCLPVHISTISVLDYVTSVSSSGYIPLVMVSPTHICIFMVPILILIRVFLIQVLCSGVYVWFWSWLLIYVHTVPTQIFSHAYNPG